MKSHLAYNLLLFLLLPLFLAERVASSQRGYCEMILLAMKHSSGDSVQSSRTDCGHHIVVICAQAYFWTSHSHAMSVFRTVEPEAKSMHAPDVICSYCRLTEHRNRTSGMLTYSVLSVFLPRVVWTIGVVRVYRDSKSWERAWERTFLSGEPGRRKRLKVLWPKSEKSTGTSVLGF